MTLTKIEEDARWANDQVSQTLFCDVRENGCHVMLVMTYKYLKDPRERANGGFCGDWTCYIGAYPTSMGTETVAQRVRDVGQKMPESIAREFFGGRIEYLEKEYGIKFRP